MASSFHIENFGCRAARADGEAVASLLRAAGLEQGPPSDADVVVVNTCSVTAEADREARAFIRRANRLNPGARIVATGCYAQRAPEELANLPGVAAVVGNSHKAFAPEIAINLAKPSASKLANLSASNLARYLEQTKGTGFSPYVQSAISNGALAPEGNPVPGTGIVSIQSLLASNQPLILADDAFAHSFLEEAPVVPGTQTRPNLKIQEGCSNRCSFCVIPQTRGSSRSLPNSAILRHVQSFVSAGGNELVLSGINLGRWGRDLSQPGEPRLTLAALVRQIFGQTDLPRLRLSSIEPMDWDVDLIALMAAYGGTRLARHAHLPLQSGSDAVLRRMHRRYRPWHYAEKVSALFRAAGPDLTLGADVMAGFPGETENEFNETVEFIRGLPFGYLHLFPFSPRPGTRAWTLHAESPVPPGVVAERMATLRSLAAEKAHTHRRSFIGAELDAITLHTPQAMASADRTSALTENFVPVELAGSMPANSLIRISVTGLCAEGTLFARLASSTNAYGFPPDLITPSHSRIERIPQTVV
jgi:threonylcarbamoyladenosine tRNA methylthiotransferase MtaB